MVHRVIAAFEYAKSLLGGKVPELQEATGPIRYALLDESAGIASVGLRHPLVSIVSIERRMPLGAYLCTRASYRRVRLLRKNLENALPRGYSFRASVSSRGRLLYKIFKKGELVCQVARFSPTGAMHFNFKSAYAKPLVAALFGGRGVKLSAVRKRGI